MNFVEFDVGFRNHRLIFLETRKTKSFAAVQFGVNGETAATMGAKRAFMRWAGSELFLFEFY
jgi:hypothetical protein